MQRVDGQPDHAVASFQVGVGGSSCVGSFRNRPRYPDTVRSMYWRDAAFDEGDGCYGPFLSDYRPFSLLDLVFADLIRLRMIVHIWRYGASMKAEMIDDW